MKRLLTMLAVTVLVSSCAKEEKNNGPTGSLSKPREKTTLLFKSRISSTETATLVLSKDPVTGEISATRTVEPAAPTDIYACYTLGLAPGTPSGNTLVVPTTEPCYFISFEHDNPIETIEAGTDVIFTCECDETTLAMATEDNCNIVALPYLREQVFEISCDAAPKKPKKKTGRLIRGKNECGLIMMPSYPIH